MRRSLACSISAAALLMSAAPVQAAPAPKLAAERLAIATSRAPGVEPGQPSVAVDIREGFVLTWQERARASGEATLWFAVIDRDGRERRRGRIASGGDWFVNWADFPSLLVLENGDWVTHYLQKSGSSPYAYALRIVRSTDGGRTWGEPVTPHRDGTPTQHGFVAFEAVGADRVLVIWLDGRHGVHAEGHADHEDGPMSLRAAVLDRSGRLDEEHELDDSTCSCCQTDMVRIGKRVLAAYRDRSADEIRDIALLTRADGGGWSKPAALHADGWRIEGCPVNGPALAAHGERWLAVWPTQASGASEVRYLVASEASPDGRRQARVLGRGPGTLGRVDAAAWPAGFLVSWLGGSGKAAGLNLALVGFDGRVIARRTVAAVPPTRVSGNPRLASLDGRALLAWIEPAPDTRGATAAGDGSTRKADGSALAVALVRAAR